MHQTLFSEKRLHDVAVREPVLLIDPLAFARCFNREHFLVAHGLVGHPLFEISRLLQLAKDVAEKWPDDIYYDRGVTQIGQRWSTKPPTFSVAETIRNLESAGAWIDLKSAERDPDYASVLDRCIGDMLQLSGRELRSKIRRTQMAIFITSPARLSTYHIDSECNFLLHIRGQKQISLFNKYDRDVLPEEEIERSWTVDTNAAVYRAGLQSRADVVTLTPGTGVHIPVNAPHWVQNGNEISVSAAILFHWWNREYANVYAANYVLRNKFGLHPKPPFESRLLDLIKQPLGAAFIGLRTARHGPLRRY